MMKILSFYIRRPVIMTFALFMTSEMHSQGLVFGRVEDAFLKTPLPEG